MNKELKNAPPVDEDDLSFSSSASQAILHQTPKGGQQLLWAIMVFVVVMIVWAYMAEIDEFTRGQGQVIPSQYLQVVQNLEGGIVKDIFVKEGQSVKRGQELVQLDVVGIGSEVNTVKIKRDQLVAQSARLQAEAEGLAFPEVELVGNVPEVIINSERALYIARAEELSASNQVILQQIAQKRQELSEWGVKLQGYRNSHRLLNDELDITKPLLDTGAVSRVDVLRLEKDVSEVKNQMESARLTIPRIQSSLRESEDKLVAAERAFKSQARSEYSQVRAELQQLQQSSRKVEDQLDRTLSVSPVDGTIKQVFVRTVGGVIGAGRDLVAIVPTEDKLRVEAKILPADIAFLHPDQKAVVKFTAYDFSIHGGLDGKVVQISPDTIVDDQGESFYLVQIETEKSFLGSEQDSLPIIAGMTVNVDILTGKKTILDYILKPILKTKQLALRER